MSTYAIPEFKHRQKVAANEVLLVANGDLRQSANEVCWPAQSNLEEMLKAAFAEEGMVLRRAHAYDAERKHGFISSQRMGMDVFTHIDPEAPLVVAEAVWQYKQPSARRADCASWARSLPARPVVGAMARPGRDAQSQWQPAQGWRAVQHDLEQGFPGSVLRRSGRCRCGFIRSTSSADESHVREFVASQVPAAESRTWGLLLPISGQAEQRPSWSVFDEGPHGHDGRDHRRQPAQPRRHL